MAREFWLNKCPVVKTSKINKKFTIPVFSVECGEVKKCLELRTDYTTQGYVSQILDVGVPDITNAFTVEAWIKLSNLPFKFNDDDGYAYIFQRSDDNLLASLSVSENGNVDFFLRKGGVLTQCATDDWVIPANKWVFVTGSWDGVTMRIFVNGELEGSTALLAPIDSFTSGARIHYLGIGTFNNSSENFRQFSGYIDEVRIWEEGRTEDQIKFSMFSPRDLTGAIDTTLRYYYKLQDESNLGAGEIVGVDNTTVNHVDDELAFINVPFAAWVTDDGFPLKYGASFICNLITVIVDDPCSIKFPINKPDDPNHGLFVRYLDDSGEWQRKILYDSGESYDDIDIHPFLFSGYYNGEKLSTTFYIEVWNVDGEATADLESEIIVGLSLTSNPSDSRDHTQLVAAIPTSSTELASTYPLLNPIVTDTTQTY